MRIQTKSANINSSIADGATAGCTVSNLDFTPDALLSANIQLWGVDNHPEVSLNYPEGTRIADFDITIRDVSFGANSVTVTIENEQGVTYYIEYITVTVARTS